MIERMRTTLGHLEGQLQTFWVDYLTNKPCTWLFDRRLAATQLGEMGNVRRLLQHVQDSINSAFQVLSDPLLAPPSEKEN